ncbi:hypothetical protein [Hymenobacter tenuis]
MKEKLLFRVDKIFPLPGLGLLLLPQITAPELHQLDLYTALKLHLHYPSGHTQTVIASVEEITRDEAGVIRGLLLTQESSLQVPLGTEVWWAGTIAEWDELV